MLTNLSHTFVDNYYNNGCIIKKLTKTVSDNFVTLDLQGVLSWSLNQTVEDD